MGGVVVAVYSALVGGLLLVRPPSYTLIVDAAFLISYLALCARYGLDALRGTGDCHPAIGTMLVVGPIGMLLGADSLSRPWLPGAALVVVVAPLAVGVSFWRRGRRAKSGLVRRVEGLAILGAPLTIAALFGFLSVGPAGGVVTVMLCWLDFSYGYVASGTPWMVPGAAAGALLVWLLAWRLLKGDWRAATFLALAPVYLFGGYLLAVVYYDLPLDHTLADVVAQPHTTLLPVSLQRGPGRTLQVDADEQWLYMSVKSTNMADGGNPEMSGVLSYDIERRREGPFLHLPAPCITMIVDASRGALFSCEFFQPRILQLDLETLQPTGAQIDLDLPMRPEGLVALDDDFMLARMEIPAEGPDLLRIDRRSMEYTPIRLPSRPLVVGCYALSPDRRRKQIWVPQLGPDVVVLNRLAWDGSFEDEVRVPGISFEAVYSAHHDSVFIATLNRKVLYRVDAETLEVTTTRVPNGIRAVREAPGGLLILGDYIRGKLHIYDPVREEVLHSLLVGRKPQAITVSPSGKIYALSSFGITVFDLPLLIEEGSIQR